TPATWIFFLALALAWYAGARVKPTWVAERVTLDVKVQEDGRLAYMMRGAVTYIESPIEYADSELHPDKLAELNAEGIAPQVTSAIVRDSITIGGEQRDFYYQLTAKKHWRYWSLLPAFVAVLLCWITREPLTALFGGIVVGAFILAQYDLTVAVLVRTLATRDAAGVLILYLWLLGGLMGIWSRTGAAQAFAQCMSTHFVRGPRSAKFVAWLLGMIFFQGGTMSSVLVGTTVKPLLDQHRISH